MPILSLKNVSVHKYDTPVLFDLDWQLQAGEQWAIVGANGAGKTTLLETITGRWATAAGKLTKHGVVEFVASDYSFNRIARAAAQYHQQRFHAHEAAIAPSVGELLTEQMKPVGTIDATSVSLAASQVPAVRLQEIADLLQLSTLLDQPFITLSNGETRRMLLARSLVKHPDILLLDYPFVGLDVLSRQILRDALASLARRGTTVILVTSADEIPDFITHVLALEEGRVEMTVSIEEWRGKPLSNSPKPTLSALALQSALSSPLTLQDFEYTFDLRNIKVIYHGKAVLDNINWKVKKGEKWALVGANGSGKSTLLSLLTADHPQRFANDFDLFDKKRGGRGASIWDIKKQIGHVSPEMHLYFPTETTVFKAIASGFFDATGVYFNKLDEVQIERIGFVADLLGVTHVMVQPLQKLSKGEQRLVMLARALVKNPPLLILDEPCQGLDIAVVEYFKSVVDAVCATENRTLVYVSHYPHEIPSCVTRTYKLDRGWGEEI